MLKIHTMSLGDYQTNCYIIHDSASSGCCVIDPGYTPDLVLDTLEDLGLTCEAILLTHGHFDHVGGVREIAAETGCRVYLHTADLTMPPMMTAGPLFLHGCLPGGRYPPSGRTDCFCPPHPRPHPRFRLSAGRKQHFLRRHPLRPGLRQNGFPRW